jgi:hypothetical protein
MSVYFFWGIRDGHFRYGGSHAGRLLRYIRGSRFGDVRLFDGDVWSGRLCGNR